MYPSYSSRHYPAHHPFLRQVLAYLGRIYAVVVWLPFAYLFLSQEESREVILYKGCFCGELK